MNKNTWIIIFFIVLAGHIIGERLHNQKTDIIYKGGRGFRINFKKTIDLNQVDQVRNDLTKAFDGERPVIKSISNDSVLDIITAYRINESSRETDSVVIARMMKGLKSNLPPDITYEQFDKEYKLEQKIVQPVRRSLNPGLSRTISPFLYYGCKTLLMPLLIFYFLGQTKSRITSLKKWIIAALLFSWAGDVLLMFVPKNELFFLMGLGSFLLAHIFYISFFHSVRVKEKVKGKPLPLLIVAAYYTVLITILLPHLGEMKVPVLVYGLVISFMFMLAMHMLFIRNKRAGQWMMTGALLFVMSDSLLAINKFYQPFEMAGILIILTYGLAQLFIVRGAIKYIKLQDG